MITKLIQDTKKWFEANYLDGDEIQGGQMLSSEECLDAVHSAQTRLLEGVVKICEGYNTDPLLYKYGLDGQLAVEKALSDIISKLRE